MIISKDVIEGKYIVSSDGWSQLTMLLPAEHQETRRTRVMSTLSSPSPMPYGSIRSVTWVGLDANPADVYIIARVLHAHGLQYTLQVLESRQRALHFFDQLAGEDLRCPDLLLLDYTLQGLDTRELLQWMRAVPACRRLRIVVMTGADDPAVQAEALALGADAFFQKPVGFHRFLALGDLIKAVVFGHTQA